MVEARGPVRCAMCFRSILSRQNGLNRHMEQQKTNGRKSSFSVCRPIEPLKSPCRAPKKLPREPGHGVTMGPHGSPWASMENPRMSEIMDFNETHYSVRQNVGSTGSISIRNMFPLHPVTSKRPESPYGATKINWAENPVFRPIGPL